MLRHKPALFIADNIDTAELTLNDKPLTPITDAVSLADITSTPTRILQALDSMGLSETAAVSKLLMLEDEVCLVEVVEQGIGGARTKLFLVLGDLAIQLTGN